jgi:hypothetical protein
MHVVPFSSFDPSALISISEVERRPNEFSPLGSGFVRDWHINFDGVLFPSNIDKAASAQRAYTQVYHSGSIEAVASAITSGETRDGMRSTLASVQIEGLILISLTKYLKGLQALGVQPPFAVMISLIGVKGVLINVGEKAQWFHDDDVNLLNRDQYHFGEVIVGSVPSSVQGCAVMIRSFIEQLANTAGRATSSSFGANGEYLRMF